MISEKLLTMLSCPECNSDIGADSESSALLCDNCGLQFLTQNSIPVMLIEHNRTDFLNDRKHHP